LTKVSTKGTIPEEHKAMNALIRGQTTDKTRTDKAAYLAEIVTRGKRLEKEGGK
jgi:hypothetical protein